jgi:hypothetical protein
MKMKRIKEIKTYLPIYEKKRIKKRKICSTYLSTEKENISTCCPHTKGKNKERKIFTFCN